METLIRVDWWNNRQLLEPTENIAPVALEELYYQKQRGSAEPAILTYRRLRNTRGGSLRRDGVSYVG